MANALTGNIGLNDEDYQRRLRRSLMAGNQDIVRRHPPTVDHPFGREEIIPHHEWADPLVNPVHMEQAIDQQSIERARRQMMDQQHTNTGVRGMNTHARGNRITDYEFRTELAHRLEEAHPDLFNWSMEHAAEENVTPWQIIAACAIDQMNHGSVLDNQSDALIDINLELNELEEVKHGKPVAKRRPKNDQWVPF